MNTHKWSKLSVLSALGAFLLLNYQNCAPATNAPMGGTAMVGHQQIGSHVDVIDQINEGRLSFMQKSVAVQEQAESLELTGLCDQAQSGATLRWQLRDANNQDLGEGFVVCEQGGFTVAIEPVHELECGASYNLIAQLGVEESDAVEIKRACVQ